MANYGGGVVVVGEADRCRGGSMAGGEAAQPRRRIECRIKMKIR
jgi:hypothetical protein